MPVILLLPLAWREVVVVGHREVTGGLGAGCLVLGAASEVGEAAPLGARRGLASLSGDDLQGQVVGAGGVELGRPGADRGVGAPGDERVDQTSLPPPVKSSSVKPRRLKLAV
jgi:hypothetical protein